MLIVLEMKWTGNNVNNVDLPLVLKVILITQINLINTIILLLLPFITQITGM